MADRTGGRDAREEILRHASDAGEWSEEPERIEVKPSESDVVSFRLPAEEFQQLTEAAAQAGQSVSTFIRGAIKSSQQLETIKARVERLARLADEVAQRLASDPADARTNLEARAVRGELNRMRAEIDEYEAQQGASER